MIVVEGVVNASILDLLNNVNRWNRLNSWDLSGPWQGQDAVVWGLGNSIIEAVRASHSDNKIEMYIEPFNYWRLDRNSCNILIELLGKFKELRWITDFSPEELRDKTEREIREDEEVDKYSNNPGEYEARFKAECRADLVEGFLFSDENAKNRHIENQWKIIGLHPINETIEKRQKWPTRAGMTAEQAAKEFFGILEGSAIESSDTIGEPPRMPETSQLSEMDSLCIKWVNRPYLPNQKMGDFLKQNYDGYISEDQFKKLLREAGKKGLIHKNDKGRWEG